MLLFLYYYMIIILINLILVCFNKNPHFLIYLNEVLGVSSFNRVAYFIIEMVVYIDHQIHRGNFRIVINQDLIFVLE